MLKSATTALLTALLLIAFAAPVAADDDVVAVSGITIDPIAYLTPSSASIVVTGTIACESSGPADYTSTSAQQRSVSGSDNWDLYWFPCAVAPSPFTVIVESFDCDEFSTDGCFKRGRARVEVRGSDNELLATRRVFVRLASKSEQSTGHSRQSKEQSANR
jgi:hypothetical protein